MKKNYVAPEFEAVDFSSDVLTCSGQIDIDIEVGGDPNVDIDIDIDLKVREWFKEHWKGLNP